MTYSIAQPRDTFQSSFKTSALFPLQKITVEDDLPPAKKALFDQLPERMSRIPDHETDEPAFREFLVKLRPYVSFSCCCLEMSERKCLGMNLGSLSMASLERGQ